MTVKLSSVIEQLTYVLKFFELPLAVFTLFRIHLHCGSFGSIICFNFLDFSEGTKYPFSD